MAAAKISRDVLGLGQAEVDRIEALFTQADLPTSVRLAKPQLAKLFATMKLDKKVSAGEVKFVLAQKIGQVQFGVDVPKATINAALK